MLTSTTFSRALLGRVAFLLVVLGLMAGSASAQTLADLAKKEQERRKDAAPATKVITNKDLKPAAKPETAPAAADAAGAAEAKEGDAKDPAAADKGAQDKKEAAGNPATDEESWRKRAAAVREELRRNEMFAQALRTRINSLTRDYQSRDDFAQRNKLAEERADAVNELARVEQDIERAKKASDDLEDEARKAGVPPGWLR